MLVLVSSGRLAACVRACHGWGSTANVYTLGEDCWYPTRAGSGMATGTLAAVVVRSTYPAS